MPAIGTHTITLTDTLPPLNTVLKAGNGDPINLASYTVKAVMEAQDGTSELAATTTGVTAHPTQTVTLDSTNNWIYCPAHGWEVGQVWVVATSGSLSGTGLTAATRYKIVEKDIDWIRVSLQSQGAAITIAAAGSGTHTAYVVGSLQFDFASANVDTAGIYRLWFELSSGGETWYLPEGNRWYEINLVNRGN